LAGHVGRLSLGDGPASKTGARTCLKPSTAHALGWNHATTVMVYITVSQAGNGEFGVMPSAEYDGDRAAIVHEFDPFQP